MESSALIALAGGLGMFLLGVQHLTDGLKALAGDALRQALQRLVSGAWSGLLSGAVFTALIQSSSAAILTVIGFVSAGLVTFSQAVAVVIGANLGTTASTWLVAIFGFKVKISAAALPILAAGAFLWLLTKGRLRACGMVLAGFGLIFTGIEFLQNGMAGVELPLETLTGDGPATRWLLAAIGVIMTVVMQSSSAAGATTLVALAAGSITLDQAFAMVVGQNLGTTATAALAAIGAGPAVKRTALAHILFNAITGIIALLILQPIANAAREIGGWLGDSSGVLTLASFHTLFNLLGLLLFFPWINTFSRTIVRFTGRDRVSPVDRLDPTLANAGGTVALEAAWRAMMELTSIAITDIAARIDNRPITDKELAGDIQKVRDFVSRLRFEPGSSPETTRRRVMIWHALDHLASLADDVAAPEGFGPQTGITAEATAVKDALATWRAQAATDNGPNETSLAALEAASLALADARRSQRLRYFDDLAEGRIPADQAMAGLEHIRWVDGTAYHIWRLADALHAAAGKSR